MRFIVCSLLALSFSFQAKADTLLLPLAGEVFKYIVQPGDYLTKIGARFGVDVELLLRDNHLRRNAILKSGQQLTIDNRHIVPIARANGLVINLPQRMLFYFKNDTLIAAFPVGLGKADWQTPTGNFSVIEKAVDKTWRVPPSIQEEMRREGQLVKSEVPPGPDNPLGKHWLGLSLPGIGIHGTIAPASIYHFQSHGCIRLHPDDIESLFQDIEIGETGSIIYAPILLTKSDELIFLEVHRDIYNKSDVSVERLKRIADQAMLSDQIDWLAAAEVLNLKEGVARNVTLVNAAP